MQFHDVEQGYLRDILSYDSETGLFVWIKPPKNHPRLKGCAAGTESSSKGKTYVIIRINKRGYKAHRLAWLYVYGEMPREVDHINGNSLDNRISNLRSSNRLQNTQNHSRSRNSSGLPIGVRILPSGKYQARIAANHKTHYLGVFDTAAEAGEAYTSARKSLHDAPYFNGRHDEVARH